MERLKELAIKFKKETLTAEEVKEFSSLANINPFYAKNPSSWQIMESILRDIFWKLNKEKYTKLPDNWLDEFKN